MLKRVWPVVSLAALTLAGCGGGSGDVATAPPPPPPQPTQQTLANTPVGTTFTATAEQSVEARLVTNSLTGGSRRPHDLNALTSSVQTTSTGLAVTLNASDPPIAPPSFTVDLSASSAQRLGGNFYAVPGQQGSFIFVDGPRLTYASYGVWRHEDIVTIPRSDLVTSAVSYGVETSAAQLRTSGTATFNGAMSGIWVIRTEVGEIVSGNVRLDADFTAGTIAGRATNLVTRSNAGLGQFADIHFKDGRITGAGFSGTAEMGTNSSTFAYDFADARGTFGGRFYGPNSVEAGGTFALDGTDGNTALPWPVSVIGAFTTTSDAAVTVPMPTAPAITPATLDTAAPGTYASRGYSLAVTGSEINPVLATESGRTGIQKTAHGIAVETAQNGTFDVDLSASSPHRIGTDHYLTSAGAESLQFLAAQALTYSTYGVWAVTPTTTTPAAQPGAAPATSSVGLSVYGRATDLTQMPIVGTARFSGTFAGFFAIPGTFGTASSNDVQIDVDFASLNMTGSIRNLAGTQGRTSNPSPTQGRLNDITLAGSISASSYNGTATAIATPGTAYNLGAATGSVVGNFYGPNAAETAGLVTLTGTGTELHGAFAAGRP